MTPAADERQQSNIFSHDEISPPPPITYRCAYMPGFRADIGSPIFSAKVSIRAGRTRLMGDARRFNEDDMPRAALFRAAA